MAIPVRIKEEDEDGNIDDVYRNEYGITVEAENKKADENDEKIEKKMREIEAAMKSQKPTLNTKRKSLLDLRNHDDVVELWFHVGKALQPFVEELDISVQNKKWVYRAMFDHAGELKPGEKLSDRARARPQLSHFAFACRLAEFEWEFVKAMIWTHWYELFDGPLFRDDHRIIDWIKTKQDKPKSQKWLRPLTKKIRNQLKGKRTGVFPPEELHRLLDEIFEETYNEEVSAE